MFVVVSRLTVQAEYHDEGVAKALVMCERAERKPGCISNRIYTDPNNPMVCLLFAEWESKEAMVHHYQDKEQQDFIIYFSSIGVSEIVMQNYEVESVSAI